MSFFSKKDKAKAKKLEDMVDKDLMAAWMAAAASTPIGTTGSMKTFPLSSPFAPTTLPGAHFTLGDVSKDTGLEPLAIFHIAHWLGEYTKVRTSADAVALTEELTRG